MRGAGVCIGGGCLIVPPDVPRAPACTPGNGSPPMGPIGGAAADLAADSVVTRTARGFWLICFATCGRSLTDPLRTAKPADPGATLTCFGIPEPEYAVRPWPTITN